MTMFNTLASYLLGTSNQQQPSGGVEERNVRLTSVISEDDWVLVDRDSEGNSEVESSSTESLDGYDNLNNLNQLPHLLTRSSSTASLPCTTMEESWFVTPPPCFTSAGPVHMETSPLENLLIEHPSMSVYQHSHPALVAQRHNSVPVQSVDTSDFSADEDEEVEVQVQVQRENRNNRFEIPYHLRMQLEALYRERHLRAQRRNRIDVLREKEKEVVSENKRAQKVQVHKACQSLKRKYLDRANKAREVNCRNRHQRRSERSQGATRSYANNNRKC